MMHRGRKASDVILEDEQQGEGSSSNESYEHSNRASGMLRVDSDWGISDSIDILAHFNLRKEKKQEAGTRPNGRWTREVEVVTCKQTGASRVRSRCMARTT